MADGCIELFHVETDEAAVLFVFEPLDYGCGVFPLVEVVFFRDCAVDAVEDQPHEVRERQSQQKDPQLHQQHNSSVLSGTQNNGSNCER